MGCISRGRAWHVPDFETEAKSKESQSTNERVFLPLAGLGGFGT